MRPSSKGGLHLKARPTWMAVDFSSNSLGEKPSVDSSSNRSSRRSRLLLSVVNKRIKKKIQEEELWSTRAEERQGLQPGAACNLTSRAPISLMKFEMVNMGRPLGTPCSMSMTLMATSIEVSAL